MPWEPSPDAHLIETLSRYDMPLISVIEAGSSVYLFRCLAGELDDTNAWAYAQIEPADLLRLKSDSEPLERVIDAIYEEVERRGEGVELAIAETDHGITHHHYFEAGELPIHAPDFILGYFPGEYRSLLMHALGLDDDSD
jgi:hypothetical protein